MAHAPRTLLMVLLLLVAANLWWYAQVCSLTLVLTERVWLLLPFARHSCLALRVPRDAQMLPAKPNAQLPPALPVHPLFVQAVLVFEAIATVAQ